MEQSLGVGLGNKDSWATPHNEEGKFLFELLVSTKKLGKKAKKPDFWTSNQSFLEQGCPIFNFKLFALF